MKRIHREEEVQQVFVLEHLHGLKGLPGRGNSLDKIVGNAFLCLVDFELQLLAEGVLIPAVHHDLMDIEQDCINILGLVENLHMMGETDAQKIVPVDFGRHRRPIYKL